MNKKGIQKNYFRRKRILGKIIFILCVNVRLKLPKNGVGQYLCKILGSSFQKIFFLNISEKGYLT